LQSDRYAKRQSNVEKKTKEKSTGFNIHSETDKQKDNQTWKRRPSLSLGLVMAFDKVPTVNYG